MSDLVQSHNELLAIVQAYVAVNEEALLSTPYLHKKIQGAINRGIKTKKSVAVTTDTNINH